MKLDEVKSPEDLLIFLDNINYGVIDKNGNVLNDSSSEEFQIACNNDWYVRDVNEIIKSKVGHCYDQVEIERKWFALKGYQFKTFWVSAYQEEIENSGFSHTYLVFFDKTNRTWNLFEHSDYNNKGIYSFATLQEAIDYQSSNQVKYAANQIKPIKKYSIFLKEFFKPPLNLKMQEYLNFVTCDKISDRP